MIDESESTIVVQHCLQGHVGTMQKFPSLKHEKRPTSDRLKRSVDPSLFASNREILHEMIALSLSTPAELEHDAFSASFNPLRASSPATFSFAASVSAVPGMDQPHLVVALDTQDPVAWQEVFNNRTVGGKALVSEKKCFFFFFFFFFKKKKIFLVQHLAEMIAHARLTSESIIDVPKAAAITTHGYKLFVQEHKLEQDLNRLLAEQPADLEHQLVGIRDRFIKGKVFLTKNTRRKVLFFFLIHVFSFQLRCRFN